MITKLVCGAALSMAFATVAEAKTVWHHYGAIPVRGDRILERAYSDAVSHCEFEGYRSHERHSVFLGVEQTPEMSGCLSRKGFIHQGGKVYAYPVAKITYKK